MPRAAIPIEEKIRRLNANPEFRRPDKDPRIIEGLHKMRLRAIEHMLRENGEVDTLDTLLGNAHEELNDLLQRAIYARQTPLEDRIPPEEIGWLRKSLREATALDKYRDEIETHIKISTDLLKGYAKTRDSLSLVRLHDALARLNHLTNSDLSPLTGPGVYTPNTETALDAVTHILHKDKAYTDNLQANRRFLESIDPKLLFIEARHYDLLKRLVEDRETEHQAVINVKKTARGDYQVIPTSIITARLDLPFVTPINAEIRTHGGITDLHSHFRKPGKTEPKPSGGDLDAAEIEGPSFLIAPKTGSGNTLWFYNSERDVFKVKVRRERTARVRENAKEL